MVARWHPLGQMNTFMKNLTEIFCTYAELFHFELSPPLPPDESSATCQQPLAPDIVAILHQLEHNIPEPMSDNVHELPTSFAI